MRKKKIILRREKGNNSVTFTIQGQIHSHDFKVTSSNLFRRIQKDFNM